MLDFIHNRRIKRYEKQLKEFFALVRKLSQYTDYQPDYLDVYTYSVSRGPNGPTKYVFLYKRRKYFDGSDYKHFDLEYIDQLPIFISNLHYAIEEAEAIREYFRENPHINPIFTGLPYGAYDKTRRV